MNLLHKVLNIAKIALDLLLIVLLVIYIKEYREKALTDVEDREVMQ